jgi:hypothetical protein
LCVLDEGAAATAATRSRAWMRALFWAPAVVYIAANYLLLGRAPSIWHQLNAALDGNGRAALIALYSVVGIGALVMIARNGRRSLAVYAITLALVGAFFAMYSMERQAAEKIHMAQYGAFGLLLFTALRFDFDPRGRALYAIGIAIGIVAGLTDELIQAILPNRVFTFHDVVVNGASAALVLVFLRLHAPRIS